MNEHKRRGRPPKAKAISEPHINGDESREPEDVLPVKADEMTAREAFATVFTPKLEAAASQLAQAYALRVWNGQTPDLPRVVRLERVRKALEGQGLSMEGVEL